MKLKNHNQAFTLLEMLLVIAIIAILAGIVIVAINPGRQLAQARNAQRSSDLRALHSAVNQYYIDNKSWPVTTMPTTLTEICNTGTGTTTHSVDCTGLVDLSNLVPTYVPAIPTDPQVTASLPFINTVYAQSATGTGYEIAVDQSNQTVMLTAPNSLEYDLTPVQLGTTTLSQDPSELVIEPSQCNPSAGMCDNTDCRSIFTYVDDSDTWAYSASPDKCSTTAYGSTSVDAFCSYYPGFSSGPCIGTFPSGAYDAMICPGYDVYGRAITNADCVCYGSGDDCLTAQGRQFSEYFNFSDPFFTTGQ